VKIRQVEEMQEKVRVHPLDDAFGALFISKADAARLKPRAGGYLIVDDFKQIWYMPAAEFETKFKRVPV
jgi:hypothetical protein